MATRIVRTGKPQDVLAYLNGFPDDHLRYIIDPNDSRQRQVIVENQKIFESYQLSVGQSFQLKTADKTYFCKVVAQSIWNPSLILVEGQQIHNVNDELSFTQLQQPTTAQLQSVGRDVEDSLVYVEDSLVKEQEESEKIQDVPEEIEKIIKLKSRSLPKIKLKSLASNIITIISDVEPLDQGSKPTRNSPDDGMPTPPPTRNSDGTRTPDPTRNSPDGYRRLIYAEENIPLTEYWLNCAQKHNEAKKCKPIVAIMDTGIDFRYDWTMGHENISQIGDDEFTSEIAPHCPLWFNENYTPTNIETYPDGPKVRILQKDYIGWNCVGTGRLYSNQHPNPYDDDSANKHGTRIAAIITQQTDWNVRLMILKTHDYRGVGPLFNIFCAFDYLLQRSEGVKIVNASWGYYGAPNARLTSYIEQLEAKNIWFVNAAGNQADFDDDYHGHELKLSTPTERYPACLSKPENLVVTVTSAKNRIRLRMPPSVTSVDYSWQVVENYSSTFVDVAVGAGQDGTFPEPLAENAATIKGSSYATAYFSGRLARHLSDGKMPNRILETFCTKIPNSKTSVLANQVRNGYFLFTDMDFVEEAY
jgi:Subtilase family